MIDISEKKSILRIATASGKIYLKRETIKRIKNKKVKKGEVLTIAKIAAINAVKKVPDLIPLCHPIPINIWDVVKMYEKDSKGQYPITVINEVKVNEKIKKM